MSYSPAEIARFTHLYSLNIIPLRVVVTSLTWVLYDYFETLEDEVRYIWSQQKSLAKTMYLFIRYYTLFLVVFDVIQIHTFAIPGVTSDVVCVAMDPITRLLGAISLWAIEIVMQLRVYALFDRSKGIVIFNGALFLISIISFLWIMIHNAMKRGELIASAVRLPLPGCPSINAGIQWAQWVPATLFEGVLFGFVLYKAARSATLRVRLQGRVTLTAILIGENVLYFLGVSALLIFNNLMVVGATKIPWFSFGPFHAALGIMTTHMLMHLRKVAVRVDPTELTGTDRGKQRLGEDNGGLPKFLPHAGSSNSQSSTIAISSLGAPSTPTLEDIERCEVPSRRQSTAVTTQGSWLSDLKSRSHPPLSLGAPTQINAPTVSESSTPSAGIPYR